MGDATWQAVREGLDDDTIHNLCQEYQGDACPHAIPTEHGDGTVTFDEDCGHYLFAGDGKLADPEDPSTCPYVAGFVAERAAGPER